MKGTEQHAEEAVSNSDSEREVREANDQNNRPQRRSRGREIYGTLVRKHRKLLERQLDVALRKKKLQLEFMKKEIEMKRQLHQLKMQMLRSELEYKKQVLALMNEETQDL